MPRRIRAADLTAPSSGWPGQGGVPGSFRGEGQERGEVLPIPQPTPDLTTHLDEIYGTKVSAATISRVTDVIADEVAQWQNRPLESVYPIVYIDAIWLKIRDGGVVVNKACHVAVGVDVEGRKQVLGLWLGTSEGAKFWANVLTEIRNRGAADILILCCDGLTGLPAAVNSIYPQTVVQTCVVHLLRSAMKYASYGARKAMARDMRPIYTAPTVQAAKGKTAGQTLVRDQTLTHSMKHPRSLLRPSSSGLPETGVKTD